MHIIWLLGEGVHPDMFGLPPPLKHHAEFVYVSQVNVWQTRVKTAMELHITKTLASLRKHEWQTMQNAKGNNYYDVFVMMPCLFYYTFASQSSYGLPSCLSLIFVYLYWNGQLVWTAALGALFVYVCFCVSEVTTYPIVRRDTIERRLT